MHEIAYSECFKAWMDARALYYGACEWINRIRTVVVWLRQRPAALMRHSIAILQALVKTQRRQDRDQKRIPFSSLSLHPPALYPTLDSNGSCCGVTWTWGSKRYTLEEGQRDRRRYGPDEAPPSNARWCSPPQRPSWDPCQQQHW